MRITLVSAHYPPNFVSGGTLQPQRLARGLLDRGHDVRVFAGHLDSERIPLEMWDEVDEVGLPVHWVVTTPFMGWADPLNYDNPAVAERFARHLRDHPADVVHLHALQTLGAGLVGVAKATGATVVVTMHDFWWVCARQFLVDTDYRPCSLVVAAGACQCQAGREALEARASRLAELLAPADLVLAPSRAAAEVLAANGVAPHRLEVDENGIDAGVVTPHRPAGGGQPVVVRYTGGSNPMKGADVLLEAVHQLGPHAGLHIIGHGLAEAVERDGRSLDGTVLEVAPPYGPDELDDVLSGSDVLVLPSVIRESHSLVTREALLRHVPVIVTDTLGPEEVVEDGVNGLVVPAADPALLRSALERVSDPPTLARLANGAQTPPVVRSTGDQLDGLERRYSELRQRRAVPDVPAARVRRVLFVVGIDGAPLRYRAQLPAEGLGLLGVASDIRHYRDPDVRPLAAGADVVVVYRVPATRQVLSLIERTRAAGTPVVFDADDLIFDPGIAAEIPALRLLPRPEAERWLEGVQRYRTTMEACDAYIGSTPVLVEHAQRVVGIDAHLFENGVGAVLGSASEVASARPRRPGPRVGYLSGTTTHDGDWRYIEGSVVAALERHGDAELWLGGYLQPTAAVLAPLGRRVRRIPFRPWHELPELLRDLDVNLAPLEPQSRFNDAKSSIKWLEAALVGTPTIASPSGPFSAAIDPGRTGWLADEPAAWGDALQHALRDEADRRLVGERARRHAPLCWSPHLQGQRYLAILEDVRAAAVGTRRTPSPAWVPVAGDEPWSFTRSALEPYPPDDTASLPALRGPSLGQRVQGKATLVRDRLRDEGVVLTARGAGRWLQRRLGPDRGAD